MGYFHAFTREWRHDGPVQQLPSRRGAVRKRHDSVSVRGIVFRRSYPQSPARVSDQHRVVTPEPASLALVGAGLCIAGLAMRSRQKRVISYQGEPPQTAEAVPFDTRLDFHSCTAGR